jgi:two-component system CheB/CheR fusion protein
MGHQLLDESGAEALGEQLQATQRDLLRATEELERASEVLEAQARVERSERLFRATFENAAVGMTIVDLGDRFVHANERYCEITGYTDDELREKTWRDITHPEDLRTDAALARALLAGDIPHYDLEKRYIRKDGEIAWVHLSCAVVRDAHGRPDYWIAVVQDIGERKRLEQALEQSRTELTEASRRKDEYLAILSHELRNPLASIRMAAEVVAREGREIAALTQASSVLERQSAHVAKLLEGLLDVSRINRGKLSVTRAPVELGRILRDVLADYDVDAQRGGVELRTEIDEAPIDLLGDAARLTQIFSNLVGNAVSFTPPGGTVTVSAHASGSQVEVSVADTGVGFPPELARDLFEPFRQGPQDLSRPRGGLGLGLALASGLVELSGGTIEAHSEGIGRGACFVVRLPLAPAMGLEATIEAPRPPGMLNVLVIEDNEDSAEMLREALEARGHHVDVASSGRRGVQLARDHVPDVVLCDIGLPDMNGFDVATALRGDEATREVALIAISGYGRPEDRARCQAAGFDDHLTKPVDLRTIERTIARHRRAS